MLYPIIVLILLDTSIPDTINCLSQLGLEADEIYQNKFNQ